MNGTPTSREVDGAKRHHFVPEVYLRAWSDAQDRVAVRRRSQDASFVTNIRNVGVEARLYGVGYESFWREKNFSLVEEEWPRIREELVSTGHLKASRREHASLFIALQIARTREHIAQASFVVEVAEYAKAIPPTREEVRDFLMSRYCYQPGETELEAAWTLAHVQLTNEPSLSFDDVFSVSMDVAVTKLAPLIAGLHWRVERCSTPVLWTADRPVMPWRPPGPQDQYEGLGYAECEEIRMPLTPTAMLVLERRALRSPREVAPSRFHEYNVDIALQCYEFIVCSPGRRARLDRLHLASIRPPIRFDMAPGVRTTSDGREEPLGDVIQIRIPLRTDPTAI